MVGVMRIRRSLRAQIVAVLLVGCVIGAPPGVAHRLGGAEPAPTDDNAATTNGSAPGSPTAPARTDESDAGRAGVEPAETEPGSDGAEAGAASGAPAASGAAAAVATVPAARTPRRANRLAREQSPYLRQHQFNPVDWYPWGPAAFEKARTENKPIFLSIGYSSCYWCHVMDRKVFQNEELAAYLNEHFICIKVDREERPELDEIYMTSLIVYLQAIGAPASGGWPLSMFLTPDGRPIAGGTYFPPEDTDKQMGFRTVTSRIVSLWSQSQSKLEQNASVLSTETRRLLNPPITPKSSAKLDESLVAVVVQEVVASADPEHGGLDFDVNSPDAAKFPVPQKLLLLLNEQALSPNAELSKITDAALEQMALGGIRDHLGGGFHRYSVDRAWNVPHFEKMLYDQAQLLEAYAVAYTQTNNPLYRTVAEEIVAFVDRELTSPQGGFYTAIDAESSGVEGAAYVWTAEEIERALGADAAAFKTLYGVTSQGPPSAGAPELYVLRLANADEATLAEVERLRSARERLLTKRLGRTQPLRDDKIVVSSNGLMIRALAIAAEAFQDQTLTDRATRAADYLLTRARPSQGALKHVITQNEPRLNAYLDDYAYLIDALLELHRVTKEEVWLKSAISLQQQQDEQFADERGGYFFAPSDHEQLLARAKNCYDGVLPAGNSIAARNLVRLAALTGEEGYRQEAARTLQAFLAQLETAPRGSATLARALRAYLQLPASQTSGGKSTKTPRATPTLAINMDDEAVNRDDEADATAEGARTAVAEEDASGDTVPARGTKANSGGDASAGRNIRQASNEEDALPTSDAEAPAEKVTMKAYLSVDRFPAGRTCRLAVLLDVAEGWHINANPPIPENVKPTVVKFKSKRGVKLTKLKYPKGEMLSVAGEPEPQAVYSGQVRIDGILEIPADAAGQDDEMEIELQFQACDDHECLLPKTIKLTGKLKVAEVDEDVRAVNEKLFKPAK